ncbi:hypothetical protein PHISCL_08040 [Aspergillus sclerotialis]|uniref:Uncharacterized protein n=1 Tax=Aspergillus sclerotialis TaxID=2070753 RepID=A0A3A2Z918_9EURO|nr:hypothetical protein PHISCL_08040 [Aspergillus sclerotialis]
MSPFDAGTKSQSQPLNNSSEAVKSTMLTYDAAAGLNPIQKLADQITVNTQTLSTFYRSQNLPPPSFERDSPTVTVPQSAPDEVIMARQAVMEAA